MYVGQPALRADEPRVPRSGEVGRIPGRSSYDPGVDGVHDLGGLDGFGPVGPPRGEPMFDAAWERRTARMVLGSIGLVGGPGGKFRHSIERMAPAHYLSSPY